MLHLYFRRIKLIRDVIKHRQYQRQYQQQYRAKNPSYLENQKRRREANKLKTKCDKAATFANRRAKQFGVSGWLSYGDILDIVVTTPFCYICNGEIDPILLDWSLDHVIPYSQGGTNELTNVAIVHLACNHRKKDRYDKCFPWFREPDEFNASSILLED